MTDDRDAYLTVPDGLRLHYRDHAGDPSRPPLLCLPGLTRNVRDFADLAERYSPRFRVIAFEFRGRGRSDYDHQPQRYVPPTYIADTAALLDHLDVPEAIFVGTSLGGLVTMGMAAVAPHRIAAAILNDVGPELGSAGLERIRSYVGRPVRFPDWDAAARQLAANNASFSARYTHEDWVRMARRTCREDGAEVCMDYDMAIAAPLAGAGPAPVIDMWPLFRALSTKPLLLIRGERSDLLSAETADRMQEEAPGMRVALVEGVGHAPDLDEPEAVAAIDAFLEGF
ncbi:MAG: alpha/beta hydrolase [Sphingomonas sp.]|nr:alpha/beta hydrolase [Sphingomonas sp.]MBV9528192.1 alpha/beta hydrolase [Sphingomonas sp.]